MKRSLGEVKEVQVKVAQEVGKLGVELKQQNDHTEAIPTKRRRFALPTHPYKVKPFANVLLLSQREKESRIRLRNEGLGRLCILRDEDILNIVRRLPYQFLCSTVALVSKCFMVFAAVPELRERFLFQNSHLTSLYEESLCKDPVGGGEGGEGASLERNIEKVASPLVSDLLYYSFILNDVDMEMWTDDNVPRVSGLSLDEFGREYDQKNQPVIITGLSKDWHANRAWVKEKLVPPYDEQFRGIKSLDSASSSSEWKFQHFYTNMFHFDAEKPHFAEKVFYGDDDAPRNVRLSDFEVPPYFRKDYFEVLENERPSQFRWLLVGAARSGSSFHQDPHFTAAWNTSLTGRKKFVMFPGDTLPPGVEQLGDDDFKSPPIVIKWFMEFYHTLSPGSFFECVVAPGECSFVPSGWWHTVLNLDDTIAVTQNFVNDVNLPNVISFLQSRTPDLAEKFVSALGEKHPDILTPTLKEKIQEGREGRNSGEKKSEWETLMEEDDGDFMM
eukprot:TRINITY_DN7948_c0_g1_i1.p1 TRINITY_DN7948_c0_g1~~TRINITY_DN7948_c0_g1_i1.p1  ORF type:complete len:500 (+),score=107.55 TRINITY_DN7948_c0_g1_i1:47-1546(+)